MFSRRLYIFVLSFVFVFVFLFFSVEVFAESVRALSYEQIANMPTLEAFRDAYRNLTWFEKDRLINYMIETSSYFGKEEKAFLNEKYEELVFFNKTGLMGSPKRDLFLDYLYKYYHAKKGIQGIV